MIKSSSKLVKLCTLVGAVVGTLLWSMPAQAADLGGYLSSVSFNIGPGDVSVYYLSQIFGSVNGMLPNSGSGLLPSLFLVFNGVMLLFVAFMAVYGVVLSLVNAAQQGSFLSKAMSSPWYAVRLVLGLAAVAPTPSGYSLVQIFMMWCILQGVGAADAIWHRAVDYVAINGNPNTTQVVNIDANKDVSTMPEFTVNSIAILKAGFAIADSHNNVGSMSPLSPDDIKITKDGTIKLGHDGDLGTITIGALGDLATADQLKKDPNLAKTRQQYVATQIAGMINKASSIANSMNQYKDKHDGVLGTEEAKTLLRNYALATWDGLKNLRQTIVSWQATITENNFKQGALRGNAQTGITQYGWANAGAYYHLLARYDNSSITSPGAKFTVEYSEGSATQIPAEIAGLAYGTLANIANQAGASNLPDNQGNGLMLCSGALTATSIAMMPVIPMGPMMTVMCGGLNVVGNYISHYSNSTADPMMNFVILGRSIISVTEVTAVSLFVLLTATAVIGVNVLGANPLAYLQSWTAILIPVFLAMLAPLEIMGYTLAYYLPLIPFMIFAVGVIGWLMTCLECIIAAPITMVGLVAPDGQHEVFGHSDKAVMLIFNTFLRPTLMIFGLLAAMLLTRVVLEVTNLGFMLILQSLSIGMSTISYSNVFTMFGPLIVILIYNSFIIGLVNKTFNLIHLIPDHVMKWVNHQHQPMLSSEEILRDVSSNTNQGAKTASDFMMGNIKQISSNKYGNEADHAIEQIEDDAAGGIGLRDDGAVAGNSKVTRKARSELRARGQEPGF